jgi:ketosteroid isomerase-like protein
MTTAENLARLKAAYAAWDERQAGSLDVWRELMDKDFTLKSVDERTTPSLAFARDRDSRDDALAYLAGIFEHWTMIYYRPETFVSEGDHTAVFGTCAYTHKGTRKEAHCRIACLWRWKGDRLIEMTEVFDSAVAAEAAR